MRIIIVVETFGGVFIKTDDAFLSDLWNVAIACKGLVPYFGFTCYVDSVPVLVIVQAVLIVVTLFKVTVPVTVNGTVVIVKESAEVVVGAKVKDASA